VLRTLKRSRCRRSRLLNLATDKVINSRDATWLNKVCGEWKGLSLPTTPETVTLLPVEDVEETKALAEKKGHGIEEEGEAEPEPMLFGNQEKTGTRISAGPKESKASAPTKKNVNESNQDH